MLLLTLQLQEAGGEDCNDPGSGNHPECNGSQLILGGLVQLCVLTQPPLTSSSLCPTALAPQADLAIL